MSRKRKSKYRYHNWARYLVYACKNADGEYLISEEEVLEMYERQEGKCYWTGLQMEISPYQRFPTQPSIDRLDHDLPHTPDNVVLCCLAMNMARKKTDVIWFQHFIDKLKNQFSNAMENAN